MARGKGRGHKGQHRRFTNPEELAADREKEAKERNWRRQRGDIEEESESEEEEKSASDDEDSDDKRDKAKGVEGLIEVENPNRVPKKAVKVDRLAYDLGASTSASGDLPESQLSRREREELEKQRAKENYARLHAQGKTEQARADLARLAIIKQQREEAAKKREDERKMREEKEKASKLQALKGKK